MVRLTIGAALMATGFPVAAVVWYSTSPASKRSELWTNPAFVICMTAGVIGFLLVITAAVKRLPALRVIGGNGEEFDQHLVPTEDDLNLLGGVRPKESYGKVLKVQETRGVEANHVEVRIVDADPPAIPGALPQPLPWRTGFTRYASIHAHGRDYVILHGRLFTESRLGMSERLPYRDCPGSGVATITIEVWSEGRRFDRRRFRLEELEADWPRIHELAD